MESGPFLHQQVERRADHSRCTECWRHNGEYSGMRRGGMRGEKCWQWLWCDTDGCWEGGMIETLRLVTSRWWSDDISSWEELSTVTWCHIVNIIIIDSQKIDWQILVAFSTWATAISLWLYHYLFDHYLKQRILVKCLDDVGWQAYFVAIKKLSSSSFFLWPLYFADFLMSHSDVLTMAWMVGSSFWGWGRTKEKAWSQDDDIWWVENWDGSYVSQRSPTVPWLLFPKEKNGNVITMGESELWVNILMGSLSPEIDGHRKNLISNISEDLNYFLWIKFCHISLLGMRQWETGAPWHWDDQWETGLNWWHPGMSFYKHGITFSLFQVIQPKS